MLGLLCWLLGMVVERQLVWRRSALDLPLGLLITLVLVQLALGNRPLAAWALAPSGSLDAPPALPSLVLALGTLAPSHTTSALLVFLTYAGAYVLVIHLIRTRSQLDRRPQQPAEQAEQRQELGDGQRPAAIGAGGQRSPEEECVKADATETI